MALCSDPYMDGTAPRPCGRCLSCLKSRAWKWTSRIILETLNHEKSSFITLTYNEENLPDQHPVTGKMVFPTVDPNHLKNFIKRIRRASPNTTLRYYAIGEYGDRSWRPHYHLALFGYTPCFHGQTRKRKHSEGKSCCPQCDLIQKCWSDPKTKQPFGGIDNGTLEPASAAYIAGYITKKLHKPENGALHGRYPEFSRMSRKPGLGALTMEKLSPVLLTDLGNEALNEHGDVPTLMTYGQQSLVLDRYLREQIRKHLQMEETYDPETGEVKWLAKVNAQKAFENEMQVLYENACRNEDGTWKKDAPLTRKNFVLDKDNQKIQNQKIRHELKKQLNNERQKL